MAASTSSTLAATAPPATSAPGATAGSSAASTAASTASAGELLTSLRAIQRRLERTTMPVDPDAAAAWKQANPAPRHVAALMQIVADEGLSVSTLAARLGVSLATASQVVTDLSESGMVERYDDPTDRRRTLVRVGDSHRTIADAILEGRLRPVQRALDKLRPADQQVLLRSLELIADELRNPTDD